MKKKLIAKTFRIRKEDDKKLKEFSIKVDKSESGVIRQLIQELSTQKEK